MVKIILKNKSKCVDMNDIMNDVNIIQSHLDDNSYVKFALRRITSQMGDGKIIINNGDNKIFKMLGCKNLAL